MTLNERLLIFFGWFVSRSFSFWLFLCRSFRKSVDAFAVKVLRGKAGTFATAATEEGQVVAAYFCAANHFDLLYKGTMKQKAFFDADTAGDLTYGNTARMRLLVVSPDHNTFKDLNTLFGAFFDFLVDTNRVAATRVDNSVFFLLVVYLLD